MFEDPVLLVWEIEKTTEKVQAALADFLFDANYAAKSASSVDPTDLHMQPSPGSLCIVPEVRSIQCIWGSRRYCAGCGTEACSSIYDSVCCFALIILDNYVWIEFSGFDVQVIIHVLSLMSG